MTLPENLALRPGGDAITEVPGDDPDDVIMELI